MVHKEVYLDDLTVIGSHETCISVLELLQIRRLPIAELALLSEGFIQLSEDRYTFPSLIADNKTKKNFS